MKYVRSLHLCLIKEPNPRGHISSYHRFCPTREGRGVIKGVYTKVWGSWGPSLDSPVPDEFDDLQWPFQRKSASLHRTHGLRSAEMPGMIATP